MANILQSSLMTNFLYPLVLMFVLTYAILEKINIFGTEGEKTQIHAILALVISLIFVGAVFPKIIVANLVQFMTVGLVIIFVGMMLWGFVSGNDDGKMFENAGWMAWIIGFAVFFAVLWATGVGSPLAAGIVKVFSALFNSSWSGVFWTNFLVVALIGVVIAVVLVKPKTE